MAYKALYREWRPLSFNDVVEQTHITRTLKRSIMSNKITHAYLFCGTRGTGKTSMAYIYSRAVNCLNPENGNPCNKCEICTGLLNNTIMDVIEIDAASNNSVDNIRTIKEEVMYTPSVAKFKVYIIDEVHMLSTGAFNALLKTLEEPPSHVIFILATTEPHKLPATILSRCQRYDFYRISIDGMSERLNKIAKANNVVLHEDASNMISRIGDGALRNSISLLDQCILTGEETITVDLVLQCAGIPDDIAISNLVSSLISNNPADVLKKVSEILISGKSSSQLLLAIITYYRNLLVCSSVDTPSDFLEYTKDSIDRMIAQCKSTDINTIIYSIKELSKAELTLKRSSQPRTYLEVILINLCTLNILDFEDINLLERISILENKINSISKNPAPLVAQQQQKHQEQVVEEVIVVTKNNEFNWNEIVELMHTKDYMHIYPFIKGTTTYIEDATLTIVYLNNNNLTMIANSKDKIDSIQKLVYLHTGKQYNITGKVQNSNLVIKEKEEVNNQDDTISKLAAFGISSEKIEIE